MTDEKKGYGSPAFEEANKKAQEHYAKELGLVLLDYDPFDHDGDGDVYPLMSSDTLTEKRMKQKEPTKKEVKKSFSTRTKESPPKESPPKPSTK